MKIKFNQRNFIMKQDFFNFLTRNRAYSAYMRNLKLAGRNWNDFSETEEPSNWLIRCFSWYSSTNNSIHPYKKNIGFWLHLHRKWKKWLIINN